MQPINIYKTIEQAKNEFNNEPDKKLLIQSVFYKVKSKIDKRVIYDSETPPPLSKYNLTLGWHYYEYGKHKDYQIEMAEKLMSICPIVEVCEIAFSIEKDCEKWLYVIDDISNLLIHYAIMSEKNGYTPYFVLDYPLLKSPNAQDKYLMIKHFLQRFISNNSVESNYDIIHLDKPYIDDKIIWLSIDNLIDKLSAMSKSDLICNFKQIVSKEIWDKFKIHYDDISLEFNPTLFAYWKHVDNALTAKIDCSLLCEQWNA